MSRKYQHGYEVPTNILCKRLKELSNAITNRNISFENEFTMRVPAEYDRDADLVLYEASKRLDILNERVQKIIHTQITEPGNETARVMRGIAKGELDIAESTL